MAQVSPDVNQSKPLNSNDLWRAMKSEDVTYISFLQQVINTATFLLVPLLESLTCLIFEIFRFKLLLNLSKLIIHLHFQLLFISFPHFVYSQVNSSSLTPRRITFLSYINFRSTLIAVFTTLQYNRFISKHYFSKGNVPPICNYICTPMCTDMYIFFLSKFYLLSGYAKERGMPLFFPFPI